MVHFTITREPMDDKLGAPWYVNADKRDEDGDYTWGHFPTHAEAIAYVDRVIRRAS